MAVPGALCYYKLPSWTSEYENALQHQYYSWRISQWHSGVPDMEVGAPTGGLLYAH